MNRTTLKLKKKSSPAPKQELDSMKKATPSSRNPLKDLNTTARYSSTTCSSNPSSSSSFVSIEPPKGCLRFFLPTNSSKNPPRSLNKTPKSAPISKPRSKPPISRKFRTTPYFNKSENDKDSTFRGLDHTAHKKSSPVSKEFRSNSSQKQQWSFARRSTEGDDGGKDHTPMANKIQCGSSLEGPGSEDLEDNLKTNTPPVLASISPEIQCDSSYTSTKSVCYGAGHLLSGVTDKRKCRPRGFLAVEEENSRNINDGVLGVLNYSRFSLLPAPMEASERWLSPPSKDVNDQKGSPQNASTPFPSPSSSSSYAHGFSSDICGNSSSTGDTSSSGKSARFVTPSARLNLDGVFGSEAVISNEERRCLYELPTIKISPSSGEDSWGSYNVVCTPESDSRLHDCDDGPSWHLKENGCILELDSMSNAHSSPSLSPKYRNSMCDPTDVLPLPGFSFQFTHPTNRQADLIDETQLEKTFNDWRLGISNASYENSSHSQTRISWRDGLVSRIFEMDDLDCCTLLSDEEGDINCKFDDDAVQDPVVTDINPPKGLFSTEPETFKQCNVKALESSSSCAESMSIERAELIASSDSDWNLCYINQLFDG